MSSKLELAAMTFKFFAFSPLSPPCESRINNNMGQQFFPQCTRRAFVCAFEDNYKFFYISTRTELSPSTVEM